MTEPVKVGDENEDPRIQKKNLTDHVEDMEPPKEGIFVKGNASDSIMIYGGDDNIDYDEDDCNCH